MSSPLKQVSRRWPEEYAGLLKAYVEQPSAEVLEQAVSLGRSLVENGVSLSDVAAAHASALERIDGHSAGGAETASASQALLLRLIDVYGTAYEALQRSNRRPARTGRTLERAAAGRRDGRRSPQHHEQDFRALAENARDAILIGSADGRYLYANQQAVVLTGYSAEELSTIVTIEQLIAPDEFEKVKQRCRTRLAGDAATEQYETAIVRKDGSQVPVEVTAARTLWRGEPTVLGILRDITARKQAEDALRTNETRLRLMLGQIPAVLWTVDPELRFTSSLGTGLERLGLRPNEVVGRSLYEFFRTEDREYPPIAMHRRALDGASGSFATEWENNVYQAHVEPLRDADGQIIGVIGVALDITARKRAEDALREAHNELEWRVEQRTADLQMANWELQAEVAERQRTEEALRRSEETARVLLDASPAAGILLDSAGHILAINETCARGMAGSPGELVGQWAFDFFPPEVAQGRKAHTLEVIRTGKSLCFEDEHRGRVFDNHVHPVFDSQGRVERVAVFGHDITEQRRAEEALRESEAKYRQLFETVSDALVVFDAETREFLEVNDAAVRLYGYSREEFLKLRHSDLTAEPERSDAAIKETLAGALTRIPLRYQKRKDGTVFPVEIAASAFTLGQRRVLCGVIRDISERKRAEEALRARDKALESSLSAFAICDLSGGLTYVNPAFLHVWGYDRAEEVVGKPAVELWQSPDSAGTVIETLKTQGTYAGELVGRKRDGASFQVQVLASLVRDESGRPTCMTASFVDITERKRAEAGLRESEEKLAGIVGAVTDHVSMIDQEHNIVWANGVAQRLFGPDLVGRKCYSVYHGCAEACEPCVVSEVFADGMVHEHETEVIGTDGKKLTFWCTASVAARDQDGRPKMVVEVSRDVTERKRAEEELRRRGAILSAVSFAAERFLKQTDWRASVQEVLERLGRAAAVSRVYIFENHRDEAGTLLTSQRYEWASPGVDPQIGNPGLQGMPWQAGGFARWAAALGRGALIHGHVREFPAGEQKALLPQGIKSVVVVPIFVQQNWWGFVGFDECATERVWTTAEMEAVKAAADTLGAAIQRLRTEERLREQREILENVLAHIPHSVFWKDRNSVYLGCNQNFAREAGLASSQDIVGKTDYELPWSKEQSDFYRQCDRRVVSTGQPLANIEEPQLRADGSEAIVLTSKTPLRDLDGNVVGVLGIYADITERKRAEETLRRQALVFENMYDGVIVVDTQERISDWNPGAERMFGYSRAEILGKSPQVLNRPDEGAEVTRRIHRGLLQDGRWSGRVDFVRADGSAGVCEVVSVPLCDPTGQVMGRVSVNRDITDRVRAEEEVLRRREELAHVSRLATMGEMASGLAHELNQPLSAILYYARGCARRLRADGYDVDELLAVVEKVAAQAERAGGFVDRLRTFVRKSRPRLLPIDLNLAVREAVGLAEHEASESGVRIGFHLAVRLPPVLADMTQIEQVILNLLRNGIEAMREVGPHRRRLTLHTSNAGGGAVMCAIRDTGCGFPKKCASQLFDAFYTTKPDGVGMGLPISRSIVESHGGRLWATPNPSGGATFRFTLPVYREEQRDAN